MRRHSARSATRQGEEGITLTSLRHSPRESPVSRYPLAANVLLGWQHEGTHDLGRGANSEMFRPTCSELSTPRKAKTPLFAFGLGEERLICLKAGLKYSISIVFVFAANKGGLGELQK